MSPRTEEVVVGQQSSRLVNQAQRTFVVTGGAPTGHTLLLMDTARAVPILRSRSTLGRWLSVAGTDSTCRWRGRSRHPRF